MFAPLAPLAGQGGTLGVKQGTKKIELIELFCTGLRPGSKKTIQSIKIDEVINPEAPYSLGITGIRNTGYQNRRCPASRKAIYGSSGSRHLTATMKQS